MDIYAYHYGIINKSYNNRGISNSYNTMSSNFDGVTALWGFIVSFGIGLRPRSHVCSKLLTLFFAH